jgi:hypothetical protein
MSVHGWLIQTVSLLLVQFLTLHSVADDILF